MTSEDTRFLGTKATVGEGNVGGRGDRGWECGGRVLGLLEERRIDTPVRSLECSLQPTHSMRSCIDLVSSS